MGITNDVLVCGLLLITIAAGQYVVTVSVGTCLPSLGAMSFISTGAPGPSALPAGPGVMPNRPFVFLCSVIAEKSSNLEQRTKFLRISPCFSLGDPARFSDQIPSPKQQQTSSS